MNDNKSCGCRAQGVYYSYDRQNMRPCGRASLPDNPVVAMAYVPLQTDLELYPLRKALACGTLFPMLDKPFSGGCGR